MLVLSRKPQEIVRIGDSVVVQVLSTEGNSVRLGITAPPDVKVLRKELLDRQKKVAARRIGAQGFFTKTDLSRDLLQQAVQTAIRDAHAPRIHLPDRRN